MGNKDFLVLSQPELASTNWLLCNMDFFLPILVVLSSIIDDDLTGNKDVLVVIATARIDQKSPYYPTTN